MTENSNIYAVILQALQYTTVAAAVDRPSVAQNSQNNDTATVHNIQCNCSNIEIV